MHKNQRTSVYRAVAAITGGLLLALIMAACADDSSSDTSPTPMPTAAAPSATSTPQSGSALPLDRYHYEATITLREHRANGKGKEVIFRTQGRFQAPDRHAFTYTLRLGGEVTEARSAVLIGDDAWFRRGERPWQKILPDDPQLADLLDTAFSPESPEFLGGPEFEEVRASVRRLVSTEESANGVPADHYRVGEAGWEFFGMFMARGGGPGGGGDLDWELWLAQDGGWPVRLLASARIDGEIGAFNELGLKAPVDTEFRIDISRPNDPALVVLAPE